MKLLTFLGNAREYSETTYAWNNQEKLTRFAPAATAAFLNADEVTVFLTEEAEQQWYDKLQLALPSHTKVNPIPIPQGRSEQEYWQIFNQIGDSVQKGEEVAFDITHGLRSSPLLGILSAAFLRAIDKVKLRAVLYGAYEVRDLTQNRTPIFDLTPMVTLLDWSAAADRFIRTGDSRFLADLVMDEKDKLARAARGNQVKISEIAPLGDLASSLTKISRSLGLIRPDMTMEQVSQLPQVIQKARIPLETTMGASPFSMLLQDVARSYQPLAHDSPRDEERLAERLRVEREMIHWYAEHEYWPQAVSLAREWVVSWTMLHLHLDELVGKEREEVEDMLGSTAQSYLKYKTSNLIFKLGPLASVPNGEAVLDLWLALGNTRNDIDHAGMREKPEKAEVLIKNIQKHIASLDQFALPD